jgi:hypothetical protein
MIEVKLFNLSREKPWKKAKSPEILFTRYLGGCLGIAVDLRSKIRNLSNKYLNLSFFGRDSNEDYLAIIANPQKNLDFQEFVHILCKEKKYYPNLELILTGMWIHPPNTKYLTNKREFVTNYLEYKKLPFFNKFNENPEVSITTYFDLKTGNVNNLEYKV